MPGPGTYKEETMMVINTKWKRGHLKFVGIRKTTKDRYKVMIQKFFNYLSAENIALPTDLNELDYHASEFVNYLWQSGDSLGYAHDFASGMSRFFPRAKKHLAITRSYLHNWGRTIRRTQALPLTARIVQAMVGALIALGRFDLATIFMVGFTCLLRTDEMVRLERGWIRFNSARTRAVITLMDTKRAADKQGIEQVQLDDPLALAWLSQELRKQPTGRFYEGTSRTLGEELRWIGRKLGVDHVRLTPYGFRGGGATHHFLQHGSYDKAAELGRWKQIQTARIYIEGGAADLGEWEVSNKGLERIRRSQALGRAYLQDVYIRNEREYHHPDNS